MSWWKPPPQRKRRLPNTHTPPWARSGVSRPNDWLGPRYTAWKKEIDAIFAALDAALRATHRKDWAAAEHAWEAYLAICPSDSVKYAQERIAFVRQKRAIAERKAQHPPQKQ